MSTDFKEGEDYIDKNYRKIRRLGGGGDGTVYLVCHLPTEQLRAAKCLKTDHPEQRMRELMLMKQLHHPGLPRILDILECNGKIWLVMEYIRGRSMDGIVQSEISSAQFFDLAKQLAQVLIYLHSRTVPILHLDLKPSNVLIRPDRRVILIDFGAAIPLSEGCTAGRYGTPGFAAPEQRRKEGTVDCRADIYGFGALLCYGLCGMAPGMHGEIPKAGVQRARKLYVLPLLEQCLKEEPGKRFADSRAMYRVLCLSERRYERHRNLQRVSGAALLLCLVSLFAVFHFNIGVSEVSGGTAQAEEKYEQLLERAERLGLRQAADCYREAAAMYPERNDWCGRLITRIGADYLFEAEEEKVLKELIYMVLPEDGQTFLEHQEQNSPEYGELAYRLGLLYWYFYEENGGKRAATSWFEHAVAVQSEAEVPDWLESARIHAKIGGYYETLGRRDENGVLQADYGEYWSDLKNLWSLACLQEENTGIRSQIANEILACVLLHCAEISTSEQTFSEIEEVLQSVENFFETEAKKDETEQTSDAERCLAARAALYRLKQAEPATEATAG
jgi:serine/threonine-protein kinase